MQLRFSFFALAILAIGVAAGPLPQGSDLVIRGKGGSKGPKPNLAQRVSNLPPELRNQIGNDLRTHKTIQAHFGPGSKHDRLMKEMNGKVPPNKWTDQATPAWSVFEKNRKLRRALESFDDYLEVRAKHKNGKKGPNPLKPPKASAPPKKPAPKPGPKPNLAQRVSNLPPELRNKIGNDLRTHKTIQAHFAPGSVHNRIMQEMKGKVPPTRWSDHTTAAWRILEKNRKLR
ncbi:hypothetical protein CC1G_09531 [Coprinopsis cinerea okayama7|uniref:Uncharacterized protein n=1 Tax=Coprinopsis cinerea (strain Okayama-7 / 130 / ATCC MYA-4618 / FGSC 9003) TaxID=240176 RepID=A8P0W2_COPC7|nr:hypothetical protein CC1G_09531 [Coprinopsis cinerea okayama7\|eukprot:XP_001837980.1 hypothetical protein CC1G_09531 [Coprinopsis cinerea okayama7\